MVSVEKTTKIPKFGQKSIHRPFKKIWSVDKVDKLFGKQMFADFYYISGAHSYQHVPVN